MTPMPPSPAEPPLTVGARPLVLEDLAAVARQGRPVGLSGDPAWRARVEGGASFLARLLAEDGEVYGVTTGYGDSCTVRIPSELVAELPLHLTRFHGCGLGAHLDEESTLAVLVSRLNSLAMGYSGVRMALLEQLAAFINHRILPLIPSEGSVGASGDLTPLSYVAGALAGERPVRFRGSVVPASEAMAAVGLEPLALAPKEGLALMNGTAVMTGLAGLAWLRAEHLLRLATRLTSLAVAALGSNRAHFDPRLFALKPHAGQGEAAARIFADLSGAGEDPGFRLQDRYSIRCAPHVLGVLADALPWMRRDLEHELNSANDNPLIDGDAEAVFHGGHFYGGHVAFAMDGLKTAVANVADLMDRQLALLVDARYNNGLPQNLSGATGARAAINHGLKAVQIGSSAWTAEALKHTMPASVFSRSTECHNQDKVSLGTIAARDAVRVLELGEQVAAALLVAVRQALALRERKGEPATTRLSEEAAAFAADLSKRVPFVEEDRPLEELLRGLVARVQAGAWELYR